MISREITSLKLDNAPYPRLCIYWALDKDEHGYTGKAVVWTDGNTKEEKTYEVSIRLGSPLGSIHIFFEAHDYGCFCSDSFQGVDITLRDLQWSTLYTANAIRLWKRTFQYE